MLTYLAVLLALALCIQVSVPNAMAKTGQLMRLNDTVWRLRGRVSGYKAASARQLAVVNDSLDRMLLKPGDPECKVDVVVAARKVLSRATTQLRVCLRPVEDETNEVVRHFNRATVELRNNRGSEEPEVLNTLERRCRRLADSANSAFQLCDREYSHQLARVLKFANRCGYRQNNRPSTPR